MLACAIVFGIFAHGKVLTPVGVTLGIWIILASLVDPIDRWRRSLSLPRAVLGMTIAHIGLGLAVIALATVQSFTVERDVALAAGASAGSAATISASRACTPIEGPNYGGTGARVVVTRGGAPVAILTPQKRQYWVQRQLTSVTSIRMSRGNNLLVALGDDLGAGRWSLRIQIRPLVSLIWLAALIMAIGGALAASDRRYRTERWRPSPATAAGRQSRDRRAREREPLPAAARGVRAAGGGARDRHPARTREGHHSLAADRQAGAAFRAAGSRRSCAHGRLA